MSGAPEARKRSGKPRPAPVSRPGSRLKSSESDPKTEAVEAPVAGDRDKTLSRFCPVQKSKTFVSRGQDHSAALRVPFRLGSRKLARPVPPASASLRAARGALLDCRAARNRRSEIGRAHV